MRRKFDDTPQKIKAKVKETDKREYEIFRDQTTADFLIQRTYLEGPKGEGETPSKIETRLTMEFVEDHTLEEVAAAVIEVLGLMDKAHERSEQQANENE